MKIGFFDSGVGGLTILKATAAALPQYDYLFYGDTKHVPYGDRTEAEVYELTKAGVEYLFANGCALVILACNTASAETLRKLQDEYLPLAYPDRKILGVIIPVVEEVIESEVARALLIATTRTISSGKYHFELGKLAHEHTKIEAIATPDLVPLIESQQLTQALESVEKVLSPRVGEVGGIILGCTHYTLLTARLRERYPDLQIFSQAEIIPLKLKQYLENHREIESELTKTGSRKIYLTEHREDYDRMTEQFLEGRFLVE
ncbi:glutamate racemase [Candidatus Pacebacteria bacterium]|nr:glutamate racemase [Candidatus Paceibacterota bacterium]